MDNTNFILLITQVLYTISNANIVRSPCDPKDTVCNFELVLEKRWTMAYYNPVSQQMMPVRTVGPGQFMLKSKSCTDERLLTDGEAATVITGDGVHKSVITVNGQMPGPQITVYRGQQVIVKVTNRLLNEAITMHWHGLHMRACPWMDGAGGVSHCPIQAGQSFTYKFLADEEGTHWYHPHLGSQRSMGAYGPLIILHNPLEEQTASLPNFDEDLYLVISDFMHEQSDSINYRLENDQLSCLKIGENEHYAFTKQPDGLDIGVTPYDSAIINGKGRYYPNRSPHALDTNIPFEEFPVRIGGRYRFRLISAAMLYGFTFNFHGHRLNVIGTDGAPVDPVQVDSIVIQPGERYDLWLDATDPFGTGKYWIHAENGEKLQYDHPIPVGHTSAILRYVHSGNGDDPQTHPRYCSQEDICKVLNCAAQSLRHAHTHCVHMTDLKYSGNRMDLIGDERHLNVEEESDEFFLNFHFQRSDKRYMFKPVVNGISHVQHTSPVQLYPSDDTAVHCNTTRDLEDKSEPCFCTNILNIPLNHDIYMVLFVHMPHLALSGITGTSHPIHMHGHSFEVLTIGWPKYDEETGFFQENNNDLQCLDSNCNNFTWANPNWSKGRVPGAVFDRPPRKDTVWVPGGGYALIRFRATNPGFWYMHCHMEMHNELGMALLLQVGDVTDMPKPPKDMTQCGDFTDFSDEEFMDLVQRPRPPPLQTSATFEGSYKLEMMAIENDTVANDTLDSITAAVPDECLNEDLFRTSAIVLGIMSSALFLLDAALFLGCNNRI